MVISTTTGPVDQLSVALDATGQVIAAVGDQQWANPTQCPKWSVRDLVSHVVTGNFMFASILRGAPAAASQDPLRPDGDLLSAYRDSAGRLLAAFRSPGALERVVTVPFGSVPGVVALHLRITEVLVHGWDIARATGQLARFPDDLAEQELTFSRGKLAEIPSDRSPFAPPQPVADDAPAIDRLAACLGRNVTEAAGRQGAVVTLGNNMHIFARPHRREELRRAFETVLQTRVSTVEHPGIAEPMLVVRFPGGGNLSIEFIDDAPDDDHPRLGAWLELRADAPAALMRTALDAGLREVKHAGHPYYFMVPGGQVFTIAPTS